MKANNINLDGQDSVDTLVGSLRRLRWVAPLLVMAVSASLVAGFYVMAAKDLFSREAAHQLALMTGIAAVCSWLVVVWGLRWVEQTVLAVMHEAISSRQRVDASLMLRKKIGDIAGQLQKMQRPADLAQTLLSALSGHLNAYQSLCCLWDDKQQLLVAAARYAGEGHNAHEVMTRRPRLGNLLAECASRREVMVIQAPGADYLKVGSGLGEMDPASIVLFPIQHGGKLFAVLELATVEPFDDEGLRLLQGIEPVFAMSLDILQRAERSEELLEEARATEEGSRLILSAVGDGIWSVDADGFTTFANPAALTMLGFDAADVLGKFAHELFHHHHSDGTPYEAQDCPLMQTLFDGVTREVPDEVLWRKDGTPLRVRYSSRAIRRGAEQTGAVVVFQEIKA